MLYPVVHELPRRMVPMAPDPFLTRWPYVVTRPYPVVGGRAVVCRRRPDVAQRAR